MTTGFPKDKGIHSEVFDLSNDKKNCNTLSNFPAPIELAFGGLIKNKFPLICGGFNFDIGRQSSCYVLGNNNVVTALMQPRSAGASVVLYDEILWVTGGIVNSGSLTTSTEFVRMDQPTIKGIVTRFAQCGANFLHTPLLSSERVTYNC